MLHSKFLSSIGSVGRVSANTSTNPPKMVDSADTDADELRCL